MKPSTVEFGSKRPLSTDSSKLPKKVKKKIVKLQNIKAAYCNLTKKSGIGLKTAIENGKDCQRTEILNQNFENRLIKAKILQNKNFGSKTFIFLVIFNLENVLETLDDNYFLCDNFCLKNLLHFANFFKKYIWYFRRLLAIFATFWLF